MVSPSLIADDWGDTWDFEYAGEDDGYQPQDGLTWTQLNFSGTVYVQENAPPVLSKPNPANHSTDVS